MTRCELFHKIAHQKYLMFMQCSKKVSEKNEQDPTKGTTVILNELLADEIWLAEVNLHTYTPKILKVDQITRHINFFRFVFYLKLFKTVRRAWAEADQDIRFYKI